MIQHPSQHIHRTSPSPSSRSNRSPNRLSSEAISLQRREALRKLEGLSSTSAQRAQALLAYGGGVPMQRNGGFYACLSPVERGLFLSPPQSPGAAAPTRPTLGGAASFSRPVGIRDDVAVTDYFGRGALGASSTSPPGCFAWSSTASTPCGWTP